MTDRQRQTGGCGCSRESDFDAQRAFENLSVQYRDLANRVAEYMGEAGLDRPDRSARAARAAAELERIIGGRPVDPDAFPECCLIGDVSAGGFLREWYCTGSLIHPRVVLTARHCISSNSVGNPSPNAVALGVDRQQDVDPKSEELIHVHRVVDHPTEDVTLLVLRRASAVEPVARATAQEVIDAGQTLLVGFGNSDPNGSMGFGTKRQVSVPVMTFRQGDDDLTDAEAVLGFNSRTEFVAGRKGSRQDSCNGDSGGPAYVHANGERKLAGATSRATDEARDLCGDGGIYVRVDQLGDWVAETIEQFVG